MRRRFSQHRQTGLIIGEVQRFTRDTTFTVPKGAYTMDYFIVGGGGGGGSWYDWNYTLGMGGNGGRILNGSTPVKQGQIWTVAIGSGGSRASSKTPLQKSATDGGPTVLYSGNTRLSAKGGRAGYNSSGSDSNKQFIKDYGVYETYYGTHGESYYHGTLAKGSNNNTLYDVYGNAIVQDFKNLPVYENYDSSSCSHRLDGFGIPEFLEEGNPTHSVSAPTYSNIAMPATYGPAPTFIRTEYGSDKWGTYSGGGYGGGGNPGYYLGNLAYGGDGISGIVCVRFRG